MPYRKRLHEDPKRRSEIATMLGRRSYGSPEFFPWARNSKCDRQFMERAYAATLFVHDIVLAVSIAQRTTGIREAGREAEAVAALKEIAGG